MSTHLNHRIRPPVTTNFISPEPFPQSKSSTPIFRSGIPLHPLVILTPSPLIEYIVSFSPSIFSYYVHPPLTHISAPSVFIHLLLPRFVFRSFVTSGSLTTTFTARACTVQYVLKGPSHGHSYQQTLTSRHPALKRLDHRHQYIRNQSVAEERKYQLSQVYAWSQASIINCDGGGCLRPVLYRKTVEPDFLFLFPLICTLTRFPPRAAALPLPQAHYKRELKRALFDIRAEFLVVAVQLPQKHSLAQRAGQRRAFVLTLSSKHWVL